MKCPSCSSAPLQPLNLESHLKASGCSACKGTWLSAADYWAWLEHHGDRLPEKAPEETPIEAAGSQKAKLCPCCKRIMLRYKVGHGLNFAVDQCGHCNGVWLDENEWDALKQRNLHDEIHLMFSAAWQSDLRKSEAQKLLSNIYAEHFKEDYDKVQEIKSWLSAHPEKERILDYLANKDPYSLGRSDAWVSTKL